MIARNILFFIMISSRVVRTSNLNCVVDAFDKERQETGKALAAQLAATAVKDASKSPKNSNNDPKFSGETLFQKAKKFVKDVVGIHDPKIEPISYATLINNYFEANSQYNSPEGRTWLSQQCFPFVDGEYKISARSQHLCGQLFHAKQDAVRTMMKFKGVAYLALGKVFKDAAHSAETEHNIEDKRSTFATVQSELKTAEKLINEFYGSFTKKFLSSFDKKWAEFMSDVIDAESKCKLSEAIQALAPTGADTADHATAIGMVMVFQKFKKDSTTCQTIKNVLADYKAVLTEKTNSLAFTHLIDRVLNKVKGKHAATAVSQNVIFPFCVTAIYDSGDHASVRVPKICTTTVDFIDEVTGELKPYAVHALESSDVIQFVKNAITQSVNEVRNDLMGDFDKLPKLVRTAWEVYLKKRQTLTELNVSTLTKRGVGEELAVPFLLGMEDLLSQTNVKASAILSAEFIDLFKGTTSNNVFAANKVTDLVETYRTTTIKSLGDVGKRAKAHQFMTKLAQKCRLMASRSRVEVCLDAIKGNPYRPYLHYRYTDAIFDLIIDRVNERLSKYDLKKSNIAEVKKKASEGIKALLEEFQDELKRLAKMKPDLVTAHTEVRALMYLLAAKTIYIDGTGLLPTQAYEYIDQFAAQNFADLTRFKLRHFEFSDLMSQLKSFVGFKTAEEKSAADKLKNLNSVEADSNLLEFGMTGVEKREVKQNLLALFENYNRFSDSLKRRLSPCAFRNDRLETAVTACGLKNNQQCLHMNPFLLAVPCPTGYDIDPKGFCVSVCPDMFTTESVRFCGKPQINLVESRPDGNGRTFKCGPGFEQDGLLCIARCPIGWRDFGGLCERPHLKFDFTSAVLMVE